LVSHIHCTAVLCRECHHRSLKSNPDKCPVCLLGCDSSEWVQLDQSQGVRPPLRMLTLSVLLTMDSEEGTGHPPVRIGHPRLVKLPNLASFTNVVKLLEQVAESQVVGIHPRSLVVVKEEGEACSRCPSFPGRCRGCSLDSLVSQDTGELQLKPGDNLAIRFPALEKNVVESCNRSRTDASMDQERLKPQLHLTDCLDAFSSREVLDSNNPWFCPICRRNQTATKTLSVWRYPDFLVIYLKRFVYLERGPAGLPGSVKLDNRVSFPLEGLDLTPYLSGPLQNGGEVFDLYGAVCHYGSVSGGHYTAFAKHINTNAWNQFNDSQVESRLPEGDGQDDVYVLFFKRSGLANSVNMVSSGPGLAKSPSYSVD